MCEEISIMDVARKNNIQIKGRSGESVRATCPICGGKSTLSITPSKNQFSCFRCGIGGNHVSLEYTLNPSEYSGENKYPLFMKNMEEYLRCGVSSSYSGPVFNYSPPQEQGYDRASDEQCSFVYYKLLRLLKLNKSHADDLKRRGLSEEDIKRYKFKTAPTEKQKYSIPKQLLAAGCDLEGVPGFYKDGDKWALKTPASSYLCPVYDGTKNLLLGFQPRLDKPIDGNKYTWLSSVGKPHGISSGTLAGILPGKRYDKAILIVEGTLKAIVVYTLLKQSLTVVSVPGVNSIKCLEPVLEMYEGQVAFECYDMDKFFKTPVLNPQNEDEEKDARTVKNVQSAIVKLEQKCSDFNIDVHHLKWNGIKEDWAKDKELGGLCSQLPEYAYTHLWNGEGKGLDDFLLGYKDPDVFVNYVITKAEKILKLKAFTN